MSARTTSAITFDDHKTHDARNVFGPGFDPSRDVRVRVDYPRPSNRETERQLIDLLQGFVNDAIDLLEVNVAYSKTKSH